MSEEDLCPGLRLDRHMVVWVFMMVWMFSILSDKHPALSLAEAQWEMTGGMKYDVTGHMKYCPHGNIVIM